MALPELREFDGQKCETLPDVVVKFPGDPATFLLLCLNQLATYAGERRIRQFARRDIEKRNDSTHNLLPFPLGIAPVFSRETGAIRSPQYLVVHVVSFPGARCPQNSALFRGERCPISTSLMDQMMHVLAQEFVSVLIPQKAKTGWIAERATALEINSINGIGGRVKNQSKFILTFALCLFRLLARGNVLNCATEPDDLAVRIAHRFATGDRPFCGRPGPDDLHIKLV